MYTLLLQSSHVPAIRLKPIFNIASNSQSLSKTLFYNCMDTVLSIGKKSDLAMINLEGRDKCKKHHLLMTIDRNIKLPVTEEDVTNLMPENHAGRI